jgi:hypothetical protein
LPDLHRVRHGANRQCNSEGDQGIREVAVEGVTLEGRGIIQPRALP